MKQPAELSTSGVNLARSVFIDFTILLGFGLTAYGAWLAYPPAGFIVAGLLSLATGLRGTRR